jgi:hypothetical protein
LADSLKPPHHHGITNVAVLESLQVGFTMLFCHDQETSRANRFDATLQVSMSERTKTIGIHGDLLYEKGNRRQ